MTRTAYEKRQARIHAGRCPRCGKPVNPWPLQRPDNCGPGIASCIRSWDDIMAAEQQLVVTE